MFSICGAYKNLILFYLSRCAFFKFSFLTPGCVVPPYPGLFGFCPFRARENILSTQIPILQRTDQNVETKFEEVNFLIAEFSFSLRHSLSPSQSALSCRKELFFLNRGPSSGLPDKVYLETSLALANGLPGFLAFLRS